MTFDDNHNLKLLYDLAGKQPYTAASYTCIREFTNNFPKPDPKPFIADEFLKTPKWVPEPPYPRIYTDNYKKTLLSS